MKTALPWLILYILTITISTFLLETFIYTEDLYYNSISENLTIERVEKVIAFKTKYWWAKYALLPIVDLIGLIFIASILCLALFLYDLPIKFSKCFEIALWGGFIFLISPFLKLLWFGLIEADYTLADIKAFPSFSLLMFFDKEELPRYLIYPIYSFNLYRLTYFLVLTRGMQVLFQRSFAQSIKMVLSTVGVWLVLLNVIVVFLTVMKS